MTRPFCHHRLAVVCLVAAMSVSAVSVTATADDYHEPFDRGRVSWQADRSDTRLIARQERQATVVREGDAAEFVRFDTAAPARATILHSLPSVPAAVEPTVSVWIQGNRPVGRLAVRLRLPNQTHPVTGKPVTCLMVGPTYDDTRAWQQLSLTVSEQALTTRLQRLRAEFAPQIAGGYLDTRDVRVDAVAIVVDLPVGETDLVTDELRFGPIVGDAVARPAVPRGSPPLQIRGGGATLDGEPFFPLATNDHDETPETLAAAGLNLIRVERYEQSTRVQELRNAGLHIMATPRRARINGEIADATIKAPAPFGEETADVLLWMLGFRVGGDRLEDVRRSVDQIRVSDRLFTQPRPIAADVIDQSRAYSRLLSVVGSSEQMVQTSRTPRDYFTALSTARSQTLPGRLAMTWIATEPSPIVAAARAPESSPPVVEPEQIWMQAYLAIAAGYRGLGFWKRSRLDDQRDPGAAERQLAISLLNRRLNLVSRWLATSKLQSAIPHEVKTLAGQPHPNVMATILRSDQGLLVIPTFVPPSGQHCPGQMAATKLRIMIPSWHDAMAWEVTTTSVRQLSLDRVAGGSEFVLDTLDQHSLILVTSQTFVPMVNEIGRQMTAGREQASADWIALAKAKLNRVTGVDAELQTVGAPRPRNAESLLATARNRVQRAEAIRASGDHDAARNYARAAMQYLRALQSDCWRGAVADLTRPTESPYTVCYQTLPDYYRQLDRLKNTPLGDPLAAAGNSLVALDPTVGDRPIPGGQFDDVVETERAGWRWLPIDRGDVHTEASFASSSVVPSVIADRTAKANRCLKVTAHAATAPSMEPAPVTGRTLLVESPPIPLRAGESIRMTARVRVSPGSSALVYESTGGHLLAVPTFGDGTWQTVSLLRDIRTDGEVTFRFELHGVGDLRIDDVRLLRTRSARDRIVVPEAIEPEPDTRTPRDLLAPFPKFPLFGKED